MTLFVTLALFALCVWGCASIGLWLSGPPRSAPTPGCTCESCWHVNDPPRMCQKKLWLMAGVGMVGLWYLLSKGARKEGYLDR